MQPFAFGVGGVVSADIAVPDHENELAFYAGVLTAGAKPLWQNDLMNNTGTPIIGLGVRTKEYETLPLMWMPHMQVADVASSVAAAVELGGTELLHGKDDEGRSLWAALVDPTGAAFGIIPAVRKEDYPDVDLRRHGHIAGLSLVTSEVETLAAFYAGVIGWHAVLSTQRDRCDLCRADGSVAATLAAPYDSTEQGVSVWFIGLPVADFDASLEQVRQRGGQVIRTDGDASFAVVRDPIGVYFTLWRWSA